jgi:MFS family permease
MVLFHLANAAMLPLVGSVLTLRSRESPAMLIAACIIVPQVMVALLSPLVGSLAQRWGRRPLLVVGFAALPLKGLCFGLIQDPHLFVAAQCLDGISAAIIGVLVPLVAADATRVTGRFALAQGLIGTGMGLGASISTLLAGFLADRLGSSTAFLGLAGVGAAAFVIIVATMPETRARSEAAMRRV